MITDLKTLQAKLKLIEKNITSQKELKSLVFENYNIAILKALGVHNEGWEELLNQATTVLQKNDENIQILQDLKYKFEQLIDNNQVSDYVLEEFENIELETNLTVSNNTQVIDEFNKSISFNLKKSLCTENILLNSIPKANVKMKPNIQEDEDEEVDGIRSNRTLLISEKDRKIYLPFWISDLKAELKRTKYKDIKGLIKARYVLDLRKFQNSITARFREAYNLVKKKDKGSAFAATQLGIELMFKYELNPAVIAACRNIDELDVYIDCLDENELDDFKFFNVEYEFAPMVQKSKDKNDFFKQ